MKIKRNQTEAINNIDYIRNTVVENLQRQINYIQKSKCKPNKYIVEYQQLDNCMAPKINEGDIILINRTMINYNMNDMFLVMTPYGAMIRNMNLISHDTIQLICANANNENFSIDDVQIIGKVVKNEF